MGPWYVKSEWRYVYQLRRLLRCIRFISITNCCCLALPQRLHCTLHSVSSSVCLSVSRLPVINGRIKYKLLSHRQGQPTSCLFSPSQYPLFVVTRGRPPTYSSLKITDRSFRYHPPHLWTYLSSWFISSASSSLCTLFSAFLFFYPYNSYHPLFVCLSIAFLHYIASIMHLFITDSHHTWAILFFRQPIVVYMGLMCSNCSLFVRAGAT